ncbi:ATP-dependent Clp protease proteolytic subunit [Seohaeicola saemankumensis]|nr:head maturation protease, ClpP-related [Seohaeicola saemankumensis]MCA0872214.1 ATP-dependent Clp protease proteolytic subunit [Seohaeicola saemankumensis]
MKSWYTIRARASGAEVLIYDEIGAYGVTAKGFLAELGALPEGTPVDLRLNSPGGSVFDAVAIYNALKRHVGDITVWIDGIAASAASYIAMAGDQIVMPENAFLMIHDPSGLVMGTAEDMRAMAEALDKVKGSLVTGYVAKSGRPEEEIAELMAAETWLDAQEALDLGFINRIAAPVKLAAAFDVARFRNAPPEVLEAAAEPVEPADAAETPPEGVADGNTQADAMPPPPEPASSVADDNAARDAAMVRAEAIAHARAVIDLCRLAGQPQRAGRFLEEGAGLDAVRAALLAAKAQTDPEIFPDHAQPGPGPSARPWGDVIARTFRQKG